MKATYRAMQVSNPGVLEMVERRTPTPGPGQVLIAVEACGVCGADAADIDKADPALQPPRVPGHEVVGRIVALGSGVPALWTLGQRVGVGRLGGHCGECLQCRQGRFQLCMNQPVVGSSCDGGYAELMLARSTGLVAIPEELRSEEAAPILCAGIATFNALKKSGAQAGDTVAVLGIGGLGHMALQYARRMGFQVVAIGRGGGIAADALALGAHIYIDNREEDAVAILKSMGGAQAIVTTIDHAETASAILAGLAPEGRLVVLNPAKSPLQVPAGLLVGGQRSILGSITGTPYGNEKALNFSVLVDVRPHIEVLPLEQANEALRKLKSGDVRYRMVLAVGN
ncbi:alcohol dehydrogenase catalytic domain-containing protein [Burkholderia vietnamiensis]|uniref:alcohol dehydrogenase catalytic domain-containing protein n=1 Tax=Burkholderia vietnamiensis TaxID=60552 RepID=UPI000754EAD5|nr:alcohol dehydrogenase catalytic domain-containing protein [Burkholderia vietnamiensis]KVR89636.1 alcohol dehydrogenase [Burkholderia vietnamiensis]KVS43879.1 alcohol dehydrogenase [Burkholderia vietnamiensis]